MKRYKLLALPAILIALPAIAQTPAPKAPVTVAIPDPVSQTTRKAFERITRFLIASAEKMPEASYGFKPTPEVMSFGEIVGHVANTSYFYGAQIKGEKNPNAGNDFKKKTAKADLVKALKDSMTYSLAAYTEMTDAKAYGTLPASAPKAGQAPPPPQVRFQPLLGLLTHCEEHYGNLVTYMRLNKLVPPSSEPKK
jgi:uncharacterized damage-inducible protein DinB